MKGKINNQDYQNIENQDEQQVYSASIGVEGESLNSMITPLSGNTAGPLNLRTPAVNEAYNVAHFNSNFTTINNAVAAIQQRLTQLESGAGNPVTPPGIPASITVHPPSVQHGSSYTVSWMPVAGATSYDVERRIGSAAWAVVANNTMSTSMTQTAPVSGATMQYQVRARNAAGISGWRMGVAIVLTAPIGKMSFVTFENAYSHYGLNPFAIWPELMANEEKVALALSKNPGLDINAALPEGVERESLISPGELSGIVIENKEFDGEGLSLCYAMSGITVRNCVFKNCKMGIRGVHLSESVIENNEFVNCETGIHIVSSDGVRISGNSIKSANAEDDCMFLKNVTDFEVKDNNLGTGRLKINGSYNSSYNGNKFYDGSDVSYMPSKNTERNEGL